MAAISSGSRSRARTPAASDLPGEECPWNDTAPMHTRRVERALLASGQVDPINGPHRASARAPPCCSSPVPRGVERWAAAAPRHPRARGGPRVPAPRVGCETADDLLRLRKCRLCRCASGVNEPGHTGSFLQNTGQPVREYPAADPIPNGSRTRSTGRIALRLAAMSSPTAHA
jgi:hypothetical protein